MMPILLINIKKNKIFETKKGLNQRTGQSRSDKFFSRLAIKYFRGDFTYLAVSFSNNRAHELAIYNSQNF